MTKQQKKKYNKKPGLVKKVYVKKRKVLWQLLKLLLYCIIFAVLTIVGIFVFYSTDLPNINSIVNIDKKPCVTIRDSKGVIIANYGDIYGNSISYEQLPSSFIDALIATEDRRFFDHNGIDIWGLIRAVIKNQLAGKVVQGGSTITQQLAKISFLSPQRSMKRKIQEAILAIKLENRFTKEEIITMYLNRVYMGRGIYGIDSAARYYFGKHIKNLNFYESAIIVGLLRAPSKYTPANDKVLTIKRAKQVLYNMVNADFLTLEEVKRAVPPKFVTRGAARGALDNPYFGNYVMDLLQDMFGTLYKDINVYTTVDIRMQSQLEVTIAKYMRDKPLSNYQAAAIVMTPSGAIKAMMGGKNYIKSQFNRATSAKRQTGSTFKLYVYLTALQYGYEVDDKLIDEEINIDGWQPRNFSRKYSGETSVAEAFAKSINTIAVKLSENVGRQNVIQMAYLLGVDSYILDSPSLALGTSDMSLLELTTGYAHIANNGYNVNPFTILKVTDKDKNILYQHVQLPSKQILNQEIVSKMKILLRKSVTEGTSKNSRINNVVSYGKTGTSQQHRDAWFVSFTDDLVAGMWVGTDDNKPMQRWITGGTVPTKIWRDFIIGLKGYHPDNQVVIPKKEKKLQYLIDSYVRKKKNIFDNIDSLMNKKTIN